MSSRKKTPTSTESSSDSTSDSSSNSSSSSSGSDSGSSSSDSDSSSSQDTTPPAPPSRNNSTTSAQGKQNTNDKSVRRRSSEASSVKPPPSNEKTSSKTPKEKTAPAVPNKPQPPPPSKSNVRNQVYSSEDDAPPPPTSKNGPKSTSSEQVNNKKKQLPSGVKTKSGPPANTGGKAPPSVVKQAKMSNNKPLPTNSSNSKKSIEKSSSSSSTGHSNSSKSKSKSIFSPDNSSADSGDESPPPKPTKAANLPKTSSISSKTGIRGKGKDGTTSNTRAKPKPPPEKEKVVVKSSESSVTSSSSGSSSSSDDSDSESESADSSPPVKKSEPKKQSVKSTKTTDTSKNNSDTENESSKPNVVRKLTRSSSTRKSRHLTGKAASETDSDAESVKRSLSKSPVKKAPVVTKGKAKNKRVDLKNFENNVKTPPVPEERKCPLEECDSLGHLGGILEKHFTIEACPMYHNLSIPDTKEYLIERRRNDDDRRKMLALLANVNADSKKYTQTLEQKMYLQKIKDMRAKVKPESKPSTALALKNEREPNLSTVVSEYDLQLFREAQAIASETIEEELKKQPASKGTKYISMGKYCMEVWYQSPYPVDAARLPKLYICEFCLRYQKSEVGMKRHSAKCVWRHPPGDEIYRKGKLGVWQVDGKRHKQYCQHLCLLAKFFLDHKTLYYDVEPFLFYVMTLADSEGCHTVGYFSKEKNSFLNYNVSCILTLPPYQRKGYGRLLIDFSYLLTRVEGKIGSPEKPLSDLGLISYRSYWKDVLLDYLCSRSGTTLSIKDVSQEMAINSYDIVSTLQALGMMKYWKGKHIILKKQDVLEEYADRVQKRGAVLKIDPACLRWTPFVPPAQTGPS